MYVLLGTFEKKINVLPATNIFYVPQTLYMCKLHPAQSKTVFKVRLGTLSAIVIAFQGVMFICKYSVYQETLLDIQMIFTLYFLLTPRTDLLSTQFFYAAFFFFLAVCGKHTLTAVNISC